MNEQKKQDSCGLMNLNILSKNDYDDLVEFLNQTMPYDDFDVESLEEQTAGDPDYEPELALMVKDDKDGNIEGFIFGVCRGPGVGGFKLFSIRDSDRSGEVGSFLLKELEKRLIERGVSNIRAGHIPLKYFHAGIDPRYTASAAILLKNGYKIEGPGQQMEVDLENVEFNTDGEEEILKKEGIFIKRLGQEDKDMFMHYLKDGSGIWFYSGMLAYNNNPISCHIALKENRVVGFACHSVATRHSFGPTGVSPRMRGKNIGGILLKRCLKDIKNMGEKKATILAAGPIYFYWKSVSAKIPRVFYEMSKDLENSTKSR